MGELTIAKSAGFCFGVTRAVNMVYEAIEKENVPIYTYGPIIHNDEVVKDMEKNGVTVINDLDELSSHEKGVMIIRSHGISKAEYDRIKTVVLRCLMQPVLLYQKFTDMWRITAQRAMIL